MNRRRKHADCLCFFLDQMAQLSALLKPQWAKYLTNNTTKRRYHGNHLEKVKEYIELKIDRYPERLEIVVGEGGPSETYFGDWWSRLHRLSSL